MTPSFGLVMIAKDEASVIEATLATAKPYLSHWVVVDTGSTDGTQELVEKALAGVPGALIEAPWVNFGVNRSQAFAAAQGTADWLLALDADMALEIDHDFEPDPAVEAYMIRMGEGSFEYRLPLLLRGDLPWESRGAVHEYTTLPDRPCVSRPTDGVRVTYLDRASAEKSAWQASLLEGELERDPDDPRTVFYLAQTYRELGRLDEARDLYGRRATMGGFEEEAWYAQYRAALLEPAWPTRAAALLAAWERRPARLEPLHSLLRELNERSLHRTAWALSSTPDRDVPGDILFVHREAWDWGITFERSIAAWWIGRRGEAAALCASLLARTDLPANIRAAVERNAQFSSEARHLGDPSLGGSG